MCPGLDQGVPPPPTGVSVPDTMNTLRDVILLALLLVFLAALTAAALIPPDSRRR